MLTPVLATALLLILLQGAQFQPARGSLVYESPCYEGKLPFVLSFNATATSNESAAFRLALHENKTGQPVPAASYAVSIKEAESNKNLVTDVFHAPNGTLFFNVVYDKEIKDTVIEGTREGFLNALVANDTSTTIRSPDISFDRAYDIQVSILGAYYIRCLFPPDMIPQADFVWSPQDGNMREVVIVPEFTLVLLPILAAAAVGAGVIYNRVRR